MDNDAHIEFDSAHIEFDSTHIEFDNTHIELHNDDSQNQKIEESESEFVEEVSVIRRLIHGWTYQTYPMGLGTGAVYVLLYNLSYKSQALMNLQIFLFLFNLAIFIFTSLILALQACLYPSRAKSLLLNPATTIFVPTLALNSATLILGLVNYGVPAKVVSWEALEVLFYCYIFLAIVICIPLLVAWYNKPHDLKTFTPAWAFLLFPMMLVGVVASRIISTMPLDSPQAVSVLFLGYMFQGLGTCMTFFYIPIYLSRIMQTGFMEGHQANGAFVMVGPPGFTVKHFSRPAEPVANDLQEMMTEEVGMVFFGVGVLMGIFFLGLCLVLFLMALIPYYSKIHKKLSEVLGLWATTFPIVGMTTVLRLLGDIFQSKALHFGQLLMTLFVCCAYVTALTCTILALCKGEILFSSSEQVLRDSNRHRGCKCKQAPA
ncbi:hypothetical protein CROQUDRAFT_65042 [Cronartium quercuum f. sp. fusiforme G11]|uniref:Uncharacterized protein n=1 Tax=Cronartium quercuum f. sp. fusiforme G11 TaxID=708437 RepID=A0A9P6TAA3_9BASI|nr:hypothetical protein CROQUDRAFT_65042 [Cronartium quercuum f. sp. fusiforme G11]